ncbi:SPX domain-containing protein [Coniochaeta ligniaria NRRL 30616]|uniref:SPX domain-containing protein n=1 Tax=Coniochaeta ligniaria NRRL 30616 TaxID=1408157 RepID=A0A1J7JN67_9PEZI|nr:SPX domain-containing protein [Coniochaeta ligniaria NRRL 30616]
MKYGQNFEKESVPEWSLHNIDYNSLKHHIKVHTTRDQASAIVIPGHRDTALSKFEDELFLELCRQHDRVDLFVSSKANELSRRLNHLSNQIQLLLARCARSRNSPSPKKQRRFLKYEQELERCNDDIQALTRFVNAQIVAFRKILKKYRKWTGSAALGSRFKDTVLSHPKSFTRRDFSYLQSQCDSLLATLRAATPTNNLSGAATPRSPTDHHAELSLTDAGHQQRDAQLELPEPAVPAHQGYWNEYDNGSEAGDNANDDGAYTIYINPDDTAFPGMATLAALFRAPLEKTRMWLASQHNRTSSTGSAPSTATSTNPPSSEHAPLLLPGDTTAYGGTSSAPRSAFTSPTSQRALARYRDRVLVVGTAGAFTASFVLLAVAAVLILTGRHRLRAEVDAGVVVGVCASLACACAALGMDMNRAVTKGWGSWALVGGAFTVACFLNGVLLVLVVGNSPI